MTLLKIKYVDVIIDFMAEINSSNGIEIFNLMLIHLFVMLLQDLRKYWRITT